jgi:hypothetical protein
MKRRRELGGTLDDKGITYVARIKATARQQQIIEEVLSFACLEGGRDTVRTEAVSMDALVEELYTVITPLAEARGLTFTAQVANAPATLLPIRARCARSCSIFSGTR